MRALILAAGLGERIRPLSDLRPKPALPVRGLPVVGFTQRLLARHGIHELAVNRHHLPDQLEWAVEMSRPDKTQVTWSDEPHLLGTGGALRRVRDFLAESDPCLLVAGDMLLDVDLSKLIDLHRTRGDAVTFLLKEDRRAPVFGTMGVDSAGRLRRIGRHFDMGGEVRAGIYAHATVISARALETLPDRERFNHLTEWIAPLLAEGADDVRGEVLSDGECTWEPVGTPAEYLAANLDFPRLSYANPDELTRETGAHCDGNVVVGSGASLGEGARLERVVVWDGEQVPAGFSARGGVFGGGRFMPCEPTGAAS
ncbi:MAG: NDP-sugar synthase [Deltaproteobacteria bacterium]|nr:NDP-sugar synthase [Deltaproteobacteria bacterium]MBW2445086.1 NDP-sugar synthase [Deltaproteobacteria bacterium]